MSICLRDGIIASSFQAAVAVNNFKTFAYTGTGLSQSFTTPGFQPDLVAILAKTLGSSPFWPTFDSTQGVGLYTNIAAATGGQVSDAQSLTSFNTTGFTVGTSTATNSLATTYQAFCWKKGNNILDVVAYTGNGANRTINHSLGIAPSMMLIVPIGGNTQGYYLYHSGMDPTTPQNVNFHWNNAAVTIQTAANIWNNTAPTSSVFSLGTNSNINMSPMAFENYLFGQVSGSSSFGTYTGNGSTSGPSVNVGFQPSMVMIAAQQASSNGVYWIYATSGGQSKINIEGGGTTTNFINITATGFTVVTTNADFNTNAAVYLYSAWK